MESSKLTELPAPDVSSITDDYQRWEYLTPFKRVYVKPFFKAIIDAQINESTVKGEY